jgi:flavorubredoxin
LIVSNIEKIADDVLVLTDTVPVDGRISWVANSAKGHEPYNEYCVLSDSRVLLIDTGVAVHGPSLVPTLKEIVGSRDLVVFTTRIELDVIGNLGRILDTFPKAKVTTTIPIEPTGLVHTAPSTPTPLPVLTLTAGSTLDAVGFGRLRTVRPLIQTLGTIWLRDAVGKTLFTTDMFCAEMMSDPAGPVIQRTINTSMTPGYVRDALLSKFDWLAMADLPPLAKAWDEFFGDFTPITIAPIHGRVLSGDNAVRGAISLYRDALFGLRQAA